MYFLWYLLIGLVAGWLANLIVKGSGSGLLVNLVVGVIGGLLGGWIFSWFGWIPVGTLGSLLTSIAGAVILLWIVSLINHKKKRLTWTIGVSIRPAAPTRSKTAKRWI